MTCLAEHSHLVSVLCIIGRVAWSLVAVAKRFWALCDNMCGRVCYCNCCQATWDIIAVAMGMLLKDAFNCYMLLCANDAQKQKAVHSSMAWYVHVLVYNAAKQMCAS
jgi:hypothetical protein